MMIHTKKHRDDDCSDASFDAPTKDEREAAAREQALDGSAAPTNRTSTEAASAPAPTMIRDATVHVENVLKRRES